MIIHLVLITALIVIVLLALCLSELRNSVSNLKPRRLVYTEQAVADPLWLIACLLPITLCIQNIIYTTIYPIAPILTFTIGISVIECHEKKETSAVGPNILPAQKNSSYELGLNLEMKKINEKDFPIIYSKKSNNYLEIFTLSDKQSNNKIEHNNKTMSIRELVKSIFDKDNSREHIHLTRNLRRCI